MAFWVAGIGSEIPSGDIVVVLVEVVVVDVEVEVVVVALNFNASRLDCDCAPVESATDSVSEYVPGVVAVTSLPDTVNPGCALYV